MQTDRDHLVLQGNKLTNLAESPPMSYKLPHHNVETLFMFNVHVHQNIILGAHPTFVSCLRCQKNVLTRLEHEVDSKTHWSAFRFGLLCLCPCAILPYCMKYFKVGRHYCSECGLYIGPKQEKSKPCCFE